VRVSKDADSLCSISSLSEEPNMDNETSELVTAAKDSIEQLIERWWAEHFPGSPVSQVTQAWNHAVAAKEDLKRRLASFTGKR
jgi:hypothetical protein